MNTFKKKSLHAAVLAGLGALGVAGTANAVHINPDGVGQVLIYPYYTVRNNNVTAMSVINSTSQTKIVKVRFLEGKNSREVLDFNLFLSPQDVWTGVILPTATGARLETNDNSCVTPSDLFNDPTTNTIRTDGTFALNEFKNYTFSGANADNPTMGTVDRTREGYIEVIEMGVVTTPLVTGFIKHGANGIPANCAALDAYDSFSTGAAPAGGFFSATQHLIAPTGDLFGRASIVNAANGTNYAFEPTALDSWWAPAVPQAAYFPSGDLNPNISLTTGIDTVSRVFVNQSDSVSGVAGVVTSQWLTSRDAVTAVLMRDSINNEFITDAVTLSKNDWVITMPTKRNHIGVGTGIGATGRPFSNNFASATPTGACDAYLLGIFNREEGSLTTAPGVILPSPRPAAAQAPGQTLCWEANVLEFGTTGLLGSTNNHRLVGAAEAFASTGATTTGSTRVTRSRQALQGPNGWAFLSFGNIGQATQSNQVMTPVNSSLNGAPDLVVRRYFGLPVIGTSFHNFTNSGVASAYGGVIPHVYGRFISP